MYNFKRHLKEKREFIFFYILISFIFFIVFRLFNIKLFPVIYATIINFFILIIYLVYDYFRNLKFDYKNDKLNFKEEVIIKDYRELLKKYEELNESFNNLDNSLKDFYTLWIHEIKTPIAANELLLKEEILNKNKLMLNNNKINEYINLLLYYIRNNSKESDFKFEKIYLDDVVKDVLRNFSINFISKKIKLKYEKCNVEVLSDEKWLYFIIEQVISNSLKYTSENGVIKIYFREDLLYIEDNGIGIKSEDIKRVFEKSYTGYSGRIYKKSTGLGLYLVKSISEKLNLEVFLRSKENEGTVFSIKFNDVTYL